MYLPLGGWITAAMAFTSGWTPRHVQDHEISTTLTRATSTHPRISPESAPITQPCSVAPIAEATFEWSRPPATRARVFAERLENVQPICVVGSRSDRNNCLLDLRPGHRVNVDASRLMLAGCETSLPAPLLAMLSAQGRNASTLEQTFDDIRVAESSGQFSVLALERRLANRLNQLSPDMKCLLDRADAYIEIPQLTFLRMITSEQEARRHGIVVPFVDPDLQLPSGDPEVRDAMLGAYIRIPSQGGTYTLLVSLASADTVEPIRQNPREHANEHRGHMFGDVPDHFETSNLRMRVVPRGESIAHTLAVHLHEGHQRYRAFAYGATREQLAPSSHAHVRQRPCPPAVQQSKPTTVRANAPAQTAAPSQVGPRAPTARAPQRPKASEPSLARSLRPEQQGAQRSRSADALARALAELERLHEQYSQQARPRYG